MTASGYLAEALALGLSSGPACLASCGPVLLPALAAERRTVGGTTLVLGEFLAGRFTGYLVFACAAWIAGVSFGLTRSTHTVVYGLADLAMAGMLAFYGFTLRRRATACEGECPAIRARAQNERFGSAAPAAIGFFSGLSLCPPFVAAGIRAAESTALGGALAFFAVFFAGTSVWFLPSIGLSLLRRYAAVAVVSRLVLLLLAGYYGYLALILLGGNLIHG